MPKKYNLGPNPNDKFFQRGAVSDLDYLSIIFYNMLLFNDNFKFV